ncbi:hypothetical protein [Pseudomonas matsuisoli]|uniref:Tetratricopeptide repeat-containing protein n=1 Tax=Pseudomonas matsuisoli TaxID=1515666 RepID=A0A917PSV7_9PSED|nr:hypothetical protein [Pseudomonas matsuisoli]GGJ90268.1 hypothetical protein GCM10009304_14880 [Pseudomonas matsuisoli]
MTRCFMGLALIATLAGCATAPCDTPWSDGECRATKLLQQNDLLQAKMLAAAGNPEYYELANALLERATPTDTTGEAEFYRAILLIRQGPQAEEVLPHLEKAADRRHPHAIALLYKVYSEPYLVAEADPVKAEHYRTLYGQLDVAKSGYPSFEKALSLVTTLVQPETQG